MYNLELGLSSGNCFINDGNIQAAVDLWISDPTTAEATYGNISNWDTSCVTDMSRLFLNKAMFNDDISQWDVSNVTTMQNMFRGATNFNQDIGDWDMSSVTDMTGMFFSATSFNQDIGVWDVSNVISLEGTFSNASSFNQDLGAWDVGNVTYMDDMLDGSAISTANYDAILQGWAAQTVQNNINLGAGGLFYCNAEAERQSCQPPRQGLNEG